MVAQAEQNDFLLFWRTRRPRGTGAIGAHWEEGGGAALMIAKEPANQERQSYSHSPMLQGPEQ